MDPKQEQLRALQARLEAAKTEQRSAYQTLEPLRQKAADVVECHGLGSAEFEQLEPQIKQANRALTVANRKVESLMGAFEAAALEGEGTPLNSGDLPGSRKESGAWLASAISHWKAHAFGAVEAFEDHPSPQAAVTTGGDLGTAITPAQHANIFFDLLSARSVGLQSGFTRMVTDKHELKIPRLVGDVGASWVEEGGLIAASDPDGDLITIKPEKIAARAVITREAFQDSTPAALAITEHSMIRQISLGLDFGFFHGSGVSPQIPGIANTVGIGVVDMGVNGAPLVNLDPFAEAIGILEQSNAEAQAIFMAPRDWKVLLKLKEDSGDSIKPLLEQQGAGTEGVKRSIFGVPVYLSSLFPVNENHGTATNASRIFVAETAQIVAVRRQDIELAVDPFYDFDHDQVGVRAIARWSVAVPNPQAVAEITGVIPA